MIPSPEKQTDTVASFAVIRTPGKFSVHATRAIPSGTKIFTLNGDLYQAPTRFSIQIDEQSHLDADTSLSFEASLDLYPWRCLNHSCAPNARIHGRDLIACQTIKAWEEITFDYNSTEFELATPFQCECKSEECCGQIRGFRYLTADQKSARSNRIAPYLRG